MFLIFLSYVMLVSGKITLPDKEPNYLSVCLHELIDTSNTLHVVNIDLQFNRPVVRLDPYKPFVWFKYQKSETVLIKFVDDFESLLNRLVQTQTYDPRSKTIVVTDKAHQSIFESLSKYYIGRVLVVETVSEKLQKIYSYEPYEFENVNKPMIGFFVWNSCLGGVLNANKTLAPLPKKWRNTTLQILNNVVPPYAIGTNGGIEVEAFEIIAQQLGLSLNYTRNEFDYWGSRVNGTYTHILGALQRREGDMALGVFHSKFDEHYDFDITCTFMEDGTRWLVPKAKFLPYWKRIGLIFTPQVYFSLLVSFTAMVLLCRSLMQCSSAGFMLFQILVESSLKRLPVKYRSLILVWVACCFILSTIFKSKMFEIMSKNRYERQIDSLRDIVESELVILIDHDIAKFYRFDSSPFETYVRENYKYCPNPRDCIARTAFVQDCVTVDFQRSNEFFLPSFIDSEGEVLFHLFKKPIFPVHIQLFFVKGYPIFGQIDGLLMQLRDFGFIEHFYDQAGHNARKALSQRSGFRAEVLAFEQTESAFFMWVMGVIASLVLFLLECALGRRKIK